LGFPTGCHLHAINDFLNEDPPENPNAKEGETPQEAETSEELEQSTKKFY
jgi:hypothetical protein